MPQADELGANKQRGIFFAATESLFVPFVPSPAPTPDLIIADEQVTITALHTAEYDTAALQPFAIPGLGADALIRA